MAHTSSMHPANPRELLASLIAIPSVNPMGRSVQGPEFLETRLTQFLVDRFRQWSVPHVVCEVRPGRSNVIAWWKAPNATRTVLLDAHQDTVPVDGMVIAPFEPTVRDGRMYGRGACDVKGGMAAMLAAFHRLACEQPAEAANVILSCTCDEEATSTGICHLMETLCGESTRGRVVPLVPDAAIVAEPTGLDIVVAHRGATRWKIKTTGVACHSSEPQRGVNAIYRMASILSALRDYAERLSRDVTPHPRCGGATLSVGRIEGGISVNTVPDTCLIEVDRRVIPGEDGWEAMRAVQAYLEKTVREPFEFLPPWLVSPPLPDDRNVPLAEALLRQVERVAGPHALCGVPYGTHASRVAASGIPAVVFGPGSIEQAHTNDEWIELNQVDLASEIYYRFCREGAK